jgi:hypothetical protein
LMRQYAGDNSEVYEMLYDKFSETCFVGRYDEENDE